MKPKFSIIVATFNRLSELRELLPSLENFQFPPSEYELIIIDDGSTDGTSAYLNSLDTKFRLMYFHQENKGPGQARNLGMNKANGEYFIFFDSDCIIPTDYLQIVDSYLTKQNVDAFGGPDDCHPSFSPLLKAINYSMTSFLGTGGTRGQKKAVTRFYPRSFNMGIHRKIFERIGGMNNLRHGQDMDWSARIYKAGYNVKLIPEAFVWHKRRTSIKKFFKQIFNWGVARINLYNLHPEMLKIVHLFPLFALTIFIASIILLLMGYPFLFYVGFYAMIAISLFIFVHSSIKNNDILVGLLSILTLFTQIFAYALGTISGLTQRILGIKTASGFTKNYYK